ncbi:MAG: CpsD/CapB family tyrosine-protein kinase [Pseudomonadota bacterium]
MEKLQAALARAREKRENDGRPVRRTEPVSRRGARRAAQENEVAARWSALAQFEPSTKHMQKMHIYADKATSEAQHFDILRTKLLLEMRRNDWTRIAITSATPGCGKTTTACNLIAGLGRQQELRGMLFDLDFRRPSVTKVLGEEAPHSFAAVLADEVPFSEHAMRWHDNTCISMTNKVVSDPARLILRSRTLEIIDTIQDEYRPHLMLFDTPPVMVSDETRGFLKNVDAVLIMAAADSTTVAQVDAVEREVAQYTNVAGIVLNKCRFLEQDYGYSY